MKGGTQGGEKERREISLPLLRPPDETEGIEQIDAASQRGTSKRHLRARLI